MMIYEQLAADIGKLVTEKQRQYGDSAGKAGAILRILYPDGIAPHQYDAVLLIVRALDKFSRIAQRGEDGQDLGGEDPWGDIAGYALLAMAMEKPQEQGNEPRRYWAAEE